MKKAHRGRRRIAEEGASRKKAHRVALKPTAEQEALFRQHAGYARFAYNWALGEFRSGLSVGEWLSERTLRPRWNKVKSTIAPWGVELSQNSAKYAIIDLGQAAESWGEYRGKTKAGQRSGRRVGFPRFKRRRHEQGFRADNGPDTVKVDGKVVVLPKIGPVAMVEQLRFEGSIREVTINRTTGTWFAWGLCPNFSPALSRRSVWHSVQLAWALAVPWGTATFLLDGPSFGPERPAMRVRLSANGGNPCRRRMEAACSYGP